MKNTIIIKNKKQINKIHKASRIVSKVHKLLRDCIQVGITTSELDARASTLIREQGGKPSFLEYRGFPFSICSSINDEIIHGFPSERKLEDGDLISIDVGVRLEGYHGDAAFSVQVGKETGKVQNLLKANRMALTEGIQAARAGNKIGDISYTIQRFSEGGGYSTIKDYGGHGIGKELHEAPFIPNYGYSNKGVTLKPGMVICIEPMLLEGRSDVIISENGWTVRTKDRKLSAHFEHTVLVTDSLPLVLSI